MAIKYDQHAKRRKHEGANLQAWSLQDGGTGHCKRLRWHLCRHAVVGEWNAIVRVSVSGRVLLPFNMKLAAGAGKFQALMRSGNELSPCVTHRIEIHILQVCHIEA